MLPVCLFVCLFVCFCLFVFVFQLAGNQSALPDYHFDIIMM